MTKKTSFVFVLGLGIAAMGMAQEQAKPPVNPVNIAGVWEVTMAGPQGEITQTVTFTQDNAVIKVKMESPMGEAEGEGTVEGNDAKWSISISTPNGDFTIGFKAKIDGDKMTGEMDLGEMGPMAFSGQRKK